MTANLEMVGVTVVYCATFSILVYSIDPTLPETSQGRPRKVKKKKPKKGTVFIKKQLVVGMSFSL